MVTDAPDKGWIWLKLGGGLIGITSIWSQIYYIKFWYIWSQI